MTTATEFVVYSLAVYRLAVLLSEDTGPGKMFERLRRFLKREAKQHKALRKTDLHHGIQCLRCSSVWVALCPVALYAIYRGALPEPARISGDLFIMTMALSSAAILWHRAFPKR